MSSRIVDTYDAGELANLCEVAKCDGVAQHQKEVELVEDLTGAYQAAQDEIASNELAKIPQAIRSAAARGDVSVDLFFMDERERQCVRDQMIKDNVKPDRVIFAEEIIETVCKKSNLRVSTEPYRCGMDNGYGTKLVLHI